MLKATPPSFPPPLVTVFKNPEESTKNPQDPVTAKKRADGFTLQQP